MKKSSSKLIIVLSIAFVLSLAAFITSAIVLNPSVKRDSTEKKERTSQLRAYVPYVSIKSFEFKKTTVKPGEEVEYDIQTEYYKDQNGEEPDEIYTDNLFRIFLKNIVSGDVVMAEDSAITGHHTFKLLSNYIMSGTYSISKFQVIAYKNGNISDKQMFTIDPNSCNTPIECNNMVQLQKNITIEDIPVEDTVPVYEYTVGLAKTDPEVVIGDKIPLNIKRLDKYEEINLQRKDLKTLLLSYTNETDGNIVNMFVKSIDSNPYIVIPSTATVGKYNLDYGYLTFVDDSFAKYMNTDTKTFSYNTSFIVKEPKKDTSKYYYSNENYNENVISELKGLDDDAVITVDASKASLISEGVFKAIKDKKQTLIIEYETSQWVFSGKDITNAKDIDVSVLFSKLTKDGTYYDEFIKKNVTGPSAMLHFSDNGDLPGKVLIKIDKESVDAYLDNPKSVYVYFYKEDSDKLVKVAMEIQSNNGFYEFYINHNSSYIMTAEEVVEKVVSNDTDMLSLNHQITINQQSLTIVYILGGVCAILAIGLLVAILTRKKKQVAAQ